MNSEDEIQATMRAVAAARGLNHTEKAFLFALATYTGEGPEASPSAATLAHHAGMNRRTLFAVTSRLEARGIVHVKRWQAPDGGLLPNTYTIDREALAALAESEPSPRVVS